MNDTERARVLRAYLQAQQCYIEISGAFMREKGRLPADEAEIDSWMRELAIDAREAN